MRWWLVLAVLLCGCLDQGGGGNVASVSELDSAEYRALVALSVAQTATEPRAPEPDDSGLLPEFVPEEPEPDTTESTELPAESAWHLQTRIVLVTADWCGPCQRWKDTEQQRLADAGWQVGEGVANHIEIVDAADCPFPVETLPTFILVRDDTELRRIEGYATAEELRELWDGPQAVESTGYPVRGGWWTVDEYARPSREYLVRHLLDNPNHAGRFDRDWLESLSYEQLHSLHSDEHEGRVQSQTRQQTQQRAVAYAYCPT